MPARPIFIGGTGSHVGKSWVAAALCRYLYRMGHRVAPFKAQNMSNNSAVCAEGGEIGRAQAAQAEACGLEPHTDMNPILLKPTGTLGSQVVLHGQPWKTLSPADYYEHFEFLLERVMAAYARLASEYDVIVIEGAGSVSELNLKDRDLVNLGLARRLHARCLLVADIDRGGVFASVAGTFQLLDRDEAPLVRSFMVNRFRGDPGLFHKAVPLLEETARRPCLGVFPWLEDLQLDEEDSQSLDERPRPCAVPRHIAPGGRVAIIRLPHISNFTDFRLLPDAAYLTRPSHERFDAIILPGTKSTIEDLAWLRESGLDTWLVRQFHGGSRVIGICGGYQMLGRRIVDPHGVESRVREAEGLGLLPAETHLMKGKLTRRVHARTPSGLRFSAYEIHMGITMPAGPAAPFATLEDGTGDGMRCGRIAGTYLHGALEHRTVLEELLGYPLPKRPEASRDRRYDRLADWFAEHVNNAVFREQYGF